MLAGPLRAEAGAFVAQHAEEVLPDGRQRVVRHGYGPERSIQTGIGALDVRRPKVRDRVAGQDEDKIRFSSAILPKWARRSRSLDALLPVLYLRGISTGDFQEALAALLGADAPNLSPSAIARLSGEWQQEYDRWQRRDLSARRHVCIRAGGGYLQARMETQAECIPVILGATPEGKTELIGFQVGVRESAQSWREPVAFGHRGRHIHRRCRHKRHRKPRRLIRPRHPDYSMAQNSPERTLLFRKFRGYKKLH